MKDIKPDELSWTDIMDDNEYKALEWTMIVATGAYNMLPDSCKEIMGDKLKKDIYRKPCR